jgi:hypothetical protein
MLSPRNDWENRHENKGMTLKVIVSTSEYGRRVSENDIVALSEHTLPEGPLEKKSLNPIFVYNHR